FPWPVDYLPAQVPVVTRVTRRTVAAESTALRKAADVTFSTSLDKRQLRPTIGTGADEVLLRTTSREQQSRAGGRTRNDWGGGCGGRREQVLLHALLVLHPFFDRDADRVRHRHDLVRPQAHRAIGGDAAELPVDLRERHARAQRERNQPADRLDVRHQGTARLAERHEDLE